MKLVMSPLARTLLLIAVIGGLGLGMYIFFSSTTQNGREPGQASLIETTTPKPEEEASVPTATSTSPETGPEKEPDLGAFEGLEDELDDLPIEWEN
jgi:hypothetical protein